MFDRAQRRIQVPGYCRIYNLASNDQKAWKHYCIRQGDNLLKSDPGRKRGDMSMGNKYRLRAEAPTKVDKNGTWNIAIAEDNNQREKDDDQCP